MRPVIVRSEQEEYLNWLLTEYRPISGGDGSEGTKDVPGDSGSSGDEGAGDGSEGTKDVPGDSGSSGDKDDKGVPWANRIAEEKRKREKVERELAEERARRQVEAEDRERIRLETERKTSTANEGEDLASLQFTDPERYQLLIEERMVEKASTRMRQEMFQNSRQKEAQETFARLTSDFPELEDKDSDFYREVDREYTSRLKRLGVPFDALLLEDTVQLLAYRKSKKPVVRTTERPPVGETGHDRTKGKPNTRLSDDSKKVAKALGLSEKRVQAAYSRDFSDEIGTGARR